MQLCINFVFHEIDRFLAGELHATRSTFSISRSRILQRLFPFPAHWGQKNKTVEPRNFLSLRLRLPISLVRSHLSAATAGYFL